MSRQAGLNQFMTNPVIAAVCDIRGFTDFTSTVDCVNQSEQVDPKRKVDLLERYDDLVRNTQLMALQAILGPMIEELKNDDSELRKEWDSYYRTRKAVPCALKSTGDGFLVAIELQQAHRYTAVPLKLQSLLAEAMTRGVTKLVTDAAEKTGEFRLLLKRFFDDWGDLLALRLEDTTFRVAGAIALGTGQVLEENVPKTWAAPRILRKYVSSPPVLEIKSDAYGHGVNLAFRLCDRAGREKKNRDDKKMSPYVLLDRRIGQLLIYQERSSYRMRTFEGYSHTRFVFNEPLKGIDELWCYALEDKKQEKEEEPPNDGSSKRALGEESGKTV